MGNKRKDENANDKAGYTTNRTVSCTFKLKCRENTDSADQAVTPPYPGNIPRVARLMALAIRFDKLLRDGVVDDYAELATLGHVSRPRITQIMSLLNLAPEIQEEILMLPATKIGRDRICERTLRPITRFLDWRIQIVKWNRLKCLTRIDKNETC